MSEVKFDYSIINGHRWADPSPVLEDQLSAFIQTGFFPEDQLVPLESMQALEAAFMLSELERIAPGLVALMSDPELGPQAEAEAHAVVTDLWTEGEAGPKSSSGAESTPCAEPTKSTGGKLSYTREPALAAVESGELNLRMGHAGAEVADIQRKLAHYDGQVDRLYGPKTKAAVEAFQSEQGLEVTGEVDAATLSALERAPYVRDTPKAAAEAVSMPAAESASSCDEPEASVMPEASTAVTQEAEAPCATSGLDAKFEAKHCEAKESLNRALARSGGNDYLAQTGASEFKKIETEAARLRAKGDGSIDGYVTRFDAKIAQTDRELEGLRGRKIDMYSETGKTEAIGLNAQIDALETQRSELSEQRNRAQKEVDGLMGRLDALGSRNVGVKGVYAQTFETYRTKDVPETSWREGAQGPMDVALESSFEKAREATNTYGQQNPNSPRGDDARKRFQDLGAQYEAMKAEGGGGLFGQTSKYEHRVNSAELRVKALVDELGTIDATKDPAEAKRRYQEVFPQYRDAVDQLTAAQKGLGVVKEKQSALLDQVSELEKGYHHPVRVGFGMYAGMR